jgi:hypothetical protein
MQCFSLYFICFFFNKIREDQVLTGGGPGEERREVAQIMYTHVSKCENNKIKEILRSSATKNKEKMHEGICNHILPSDSDFINFSLFYNDTVIH